MDTRSYIAEMHKKSTAMYQLCISYVPGLYNPYNRNGSFSRANVLNIVVCVYMGGRKRKRRNGKRERREVEVGGGRKEGV